MEFAFVFPIFLAVLIGLFAFSVLFFSYVTLNLSVREGASAIVHCPSLTCDDPKLASGSSLRSVDDIKQLVLEKSFSLSVGTANVLIEPSDTSQWVSGAAVSVTAVYDVPLPTAEMPMPGNSTLRLGKIQIRAQSVMTIE